MAISFDNHDNATLTGSSSYTRSFTTSGSNRALLIFFWASNVVSSAPTYNGVSMTQVKSFSAGGQNNYVYILPGPASGANNLVLSFGSTTTVALGVVSYAGCAQTGQPDASNNSGTEGSGNTDSNSLTSVANNCWHVGNFVNDLTSNVTAGSGTTKRSVGNVDNPIFDNNADINPAGSNTLNVNLGTTATQRWNSSVTLAPFVAAPNSTFLTFY